MNAELAGSRESRPIASLESEVTALSTALLECRAENLALVERLRMTPNMRETISRLSDIQYFMREGKHAKALTEITDLLRRLDENS